MTMMLEAKDLAIDGRLEPSDLTLNAGELTMLVGPNGAGKTSLLHALAGVGDARGRVLIDGEDLAAVSSARRMGLLSFMGASRDTKWPLAVGDYVALALPARTGLDRVDAALRSLEIESFADRRVDRLSTGERTRAMLARALVAGAKTLLLDEPCANLDPQWQLAVVEQLQAEAGRGAAILMSVHDLDLAHDYAERVIVMADGRIIADGELAEALSPAIVRDVFGVEKNGATRWKRV